MAVSIDQQFIEYIVKSLVGNPDDVKIERRIDEKGVLLELSVNPDDLGRVIGKRGATAQSIRTLLRALGTKNDARYNLKIIDTGPPPEKRQRDDDNHRDGDQKPSSDEPSPSSDDSAKADDTTAPASDEPADEPKADKPADDVDMTEDDKIPEAPAKDEAKPEDDKDDDKEDMITRTRRELADLDDLEL